jgi:hypothetical protein
VLGTFAAVAVIGAAAGFYWVKDHWPQPRFFVGQTLRLKPASELALVVNTRCFWPMGCRYQLRLAGQTESWFAENDPALP